MVYSCIWDLVGSLATILVMNLLLNLPWKNFRIWQHLAKSLAEVSWHRFDCS